MTDAPAEPAEAAPAPARPVPDGSGSHATPEPETRADRNDGDGEPPRRRLRDRLVAPPTLAAAFGALLCWFLSLWPSLLPRTATNQAAIGAISAGLGWLVFGALGGIVAWLWRRQGWRVDPAWRRWATWALLVDAAATIPAGLVLWTAWQRDQRDVMGMEHLGTWVVIPILLLSVILLAVLLVLARLIAAGVARIDRWAGRRILRPRWARLATVAIVLVILQVTTNVAGDRFVQWADTTFGLVNEGSPDGAEPPTVTTASGGPGSLVGWDTLGFQGRGFVAGVTPVAELATTAPEGVTPVEPIRVYVGIDSADTVEERNALAVAELERTGAFERKVLVVATPTGTGWINPVAARAIEHLHAGDTAIVTQQYSFLPSWIAFLVDTAGSTEVGVTLFEAVHERWSQLDPATRPRLIVFGESLGSFGAEAAFDAGDAAASFGELVERADGALLVGPTADNPLFAALVDQRDDGTPSWRPELAERPEVRVANAVAEVDAGDAAWPEPRVLYLFHPTDAIGTWRPDALWSSPEWVDDPVGRGVPDAVRWFPGITFVQESFDLMAGFSAVPGFGHDYTDAFVEAWAAVVAPDGWTDADTERLGAALAAPSDGGSSSAAPPPGS